MNGTLRFHSRDFSRRAAIKNMRIEEVRDYLDTFLTAFRKLMSLRRGAMYSWKRQHRVETLEEILRLLEAAVKKRLHLYLLNDAVPSDLDEKLIWVIRGKPGSQTEQDFNRDLLLVNMSAEPRTHWRLFGRWGPGSTSLPRHCREAELPRSGALCSPGLRAEPG